MMTFNDIKAFIDFASDPKKYKDVIDSLDARQKQWEALVEQHCALEAVDRNLEIAEKKLAMLTDELGKKQVEFDAKVEAKLAELAMLKQEAKLELEKVKQLKAETKEKQDVLKATLAESAQEAEKVKTIRASLELEQSKLTSLIEEYEQKVEKISSVLK